MPVYQVHSTTTRQSYVHGYGYRTFYLVLVRQLQQLKMCGQHCRGVPAVLIHGLDDASCGKVLAKHINTAASSSIQQQQFLFHEEGGGCYRGASGHGCTLMLRTYSSSLRYLCICSLMLYRYRYTSGIGYYGGFTIAVVCSRVH